MKPGSLIMLFTSRILVVLSHILHKMITFREESCLCLQTVWNSESQGITYQGELLSGSEVCVGLAPHHLMFKITAQATQKAVSKRNFLIN